MNTSGSCSNTCKQRDELAWITFFTNSGHSGRVGAAALEKSPVPILTQPHPRHNAGWAEGGQSPSLPVPTQVQAEGRVCCWRLLLSMCCGLAGFPSWREAFGLAMEKDAGSRAQMTCAGSHLPQRRSFRPWFVHSSFVCSLYNDSFILHM